MVIYHGTKQQINLNKSKHIENLYFGIVHVCSIEHGDVLTKIHSSTFNQVRLGHRVIVGHSHSSVKSNEPRKKKLLTFHYTGCL